MRTCATGTCDREATRALRIEFYPVKALIAYYGEAMPVGSMIIDLPLCEQHSTTVVVAEIFPREKLEPLCALLEKSRRIKVDRDGCKAVPIAFDDPDYLRLASMSEARKESVDAPH